MDIEEVRRVASKLFAALNSDPAALALGQEVKDASWELHSLLNPKEGEND